MASSALAKWDKPFGPKFSIKPLSDICPSNIKKGQGIGNDSFQSDPNNYKIMDLSSLFLERVSYCSLTFAPFDKYKHFKEKVKIFHCIELQKMLTNKDHVEKYYLPNISRVMTLFEKNLLTSLSNYTIKKVPMIIQETLDHEWNE